MGNEVNGQWSTTAQGCLATAYLRHEREKADVELIGYLTTKIHGKMELIRLQ